MFPMVGYQYLEGMMSISGYVPGARSKIAVLRTIGALEYTQLSLREKL